MSPLARVLAVLVCLVSVVQATFVIQMVAALENKDAHITELTLEKEQLASRTSVALAETVAVHTERNRNDSVLMAQLSAAAAEKESLSRTNDQLSATINDLRRANATLLAQNESQSELNLSLDTRVADLTAHNTALVRANSEADARETDLLTTINRLTYEKNRVTDEVARLQEVYASQVAEIAALEEQTGHLRGLLSRFGIDDDRFTRAPQEIQGGVTGVAVTPGDLRLLSLNVGTNDGVAEGMVFTVHGVRNGQDVYLGLAEIDQVDEATSVARMIETTNAVVENGDNVYILGFQR